MERTLSHQMWRNSVASAVSATRLAVMHQMRTHGILIKQILMMLPPSLWVPAEGS